MAKITLEQSIDFMMNPKKYVDNKGYFEKGILNKHIENIVDNAEVVKYKDYEVDNGYDDLEVHEYTIKYQNKFYQLDVYTGEENGENRIAYSIWRGEVNNLE